MKNPEKLKRERIFRLLRVTNLKESNFSEVRIKEFLDHLEHLLFMDRQTSSVIKGDITPSLEVIQNETGRLMKVMEKYRYIEGWKPVQETIQVRTAMSDALLKLRKAKHAASSSNGKANDLPFYSDYMGFDYITKFVESVDEMHLAVTETIKKYKRKRGNSDSRNALVLRKKNLARHYVESFHAHFSVIPSSSDMRYEHDIFKILLEAAGIAGDSEKHHLRWAIDLYKESLAKPRNPPESEGNQVEKGSAGDAA